MNSTSRLWLFKSALVCAALWLCLDDARAVEFEKKGSALEKALGTKKAFKTTTQIDGKPTDVFYAKGADGKATRLAIVQQRIYEPNCTHTWVIGIDAKSGAVDGVRTLEMSCPHAFPCNKPSFLDQYKGKTIAQAKTLSDEVQTIAKATGTSQLTTEAVVVALRAAQSVKGKI